MKKKIKQHDVTDCGAACLASVAAHYRLGLPIARIRQLAGTDQRGTNLLGLMQAAEKLGFTCRGVRAEEEALKTEAEFPAIAHVVVRKQLHHFVVVYKVTDKYVQVMDPATGRMDKRDWASWREEWTGVLLLLAPAEDFSAVNRKVSTLSRFRSLIQPHRATLVQALFGAIVYTVLGLSTSIYLQKITDFVLLNRNTRLLNLLSVIMIALLGLSIFIGAMKSVMVLRSGQLIDARLILGYHRHLLRLPQRFFDTMRTGEIMARIGDAVKIRAFLNDAALNLLVNVFIVIFSFGLMFTYFWKLALVLLTVIPCYVAIYWFTNRVNRRRERELMERAADLESQLVETVNGIRTIKQLGLEEYSDAKTEARFVRLLRTTYRSGINGIASGNASEFVSRLFTIILLWAGSYFVIEGAITAGELLGFYALVGYFTGPAKGLIGMNKTIQNALIAADRLFEIVDLESEQSETATLELTPALLGDIRFRGVDFGYGSRKRVFERLDLTLGTGQVTALVGESGSGKSTLASLLQKLYPVDGGKIFIGDTDLAYVSHRSLRSRIGVVPQELNLFAGSLLENIAIGDPAPDIQRILSICKELGLLPFIESLPGGFTTAVGEHGANLSGGQRQRLAIARALYREPDILILDEATSALDSGSEEFVQQTIRRLREAGKTVVLIAHRLSTVMDADKIVVLQDGKLVQEGTHEELLSATGTYRELWNKQFPSRVVRRLAA